MGGHQLKQLADWSLLTWVTWLTWVNMADLVNLADLADLVDLVDLVDLANLADQTNLADFVEISLCSYWVFVSLWQSLPNISKFIHRNNSRYPWLQSYTHPIENRYSF